MSLILRFLVSAAALWLAAEIVPGIHAGGPGAILAIALVFGLVNVLIRPVMTLLTCPVILLTLGLFTLVINGLMLWLAAWIGKSFGIDFTVHGFIPAFLGALLVSVVSTILDWVLMGKKKA